jgi:hypothetical protein
MGWVTMRGLLTKIMVNGSRFTQLLNALEGGWEIEEPVLLGSMWHSAGSGNGTYHFILRNRGEEKTTLMSLPPSPQLMVFLHENSLNINAVDAG